MSNAKPFCISKQIVYDAFLCVKRNKGSYGVDGISIAKYEENLKNNLYKLWNRMSSGCYFPMPVKRVEIPKGDGKMRPLGIPAVSDRIAQTVVKLLIEPRLEEIFSNNSYGYRPGRSAIDAVRKARERCFKYHFVVDLDIKGFFDNIDHELLMKAVKMHVKEEWILLYITRWLKAPVEMPDGLCISNDRGTPQGGVISPILANLFLHYTMDVWLEKKFPQVPFERYADDAILHFNSENHARKVLDLLKRRFADCKLELNENKTKLVFCKDAKRKLDFDEVCFTFLGYEFKPRKCLLGEKITCVFLPAMGKKAKKKFVEKLNELNIQNKSFTSIFELAKLLNPIIRGTINYFGVFCKSEMNEILNLVNLKLKRWALKKYKKRGIVKWLQRLYLTQRDLFVHWKSCKPTYFW